MQNNLKKNIHICMNHFAVQLKLTHCKLIILQLFKEIFYFIYLLLAVLGLCCCTDFSLVVASRGYSLVAVHGFLIVEASLDVEYRL